MREFEKTKNGPSTYNPEFKLIEKRIDIGVMTIREPYHEKDNFDLDLRPAIDPEQIKPNKLTFKYHMPTVHKPMHSPDNILNPGAWVFYDVDLDAVREQLAVGNVFMAGGRENQEEFAERMKFKYLLEEHIKRLNNKVPEHGDYEPYVKEDPKNILDFDKMLARDDPSKDLLQEDLEGDVLILNPNKIGKHLQDIRFEKQLGRTEPQEVDEFQDELIIEPNINVIRPKKPSAPDFSKQLGREDPLKLPDDEIYILDLPDNPIPNDPSMPRVKGIVNFGLGKDRFDNEKEMARALDLEQDELFIESADLPRRIKGFVDMQKQTEERFKVRLNEDPFY